MLCFSFSVKIIFISSCQFSRLKALAFSPLSQLLKLICRLTDSLSLSNSSIQAYFSLMILSIASVWISLYSLELKVFTSSIPSSTLLLAQGDMQLLMSRVILRLISDDLRQANSLATDLPDFNLSVIVMSLCQWPAKEKESGEKVNFSVLQRQKKKLEMGEDVLLIILIVWTLSLPNWTTSGSIVTISDRMLLLNLKNYYYKRFKSLLLSLVSIDRMRVLVSWRLDFGSQ